jgi:REP element-mobilizing transposase RayT
LLNQIQQGYAKTPQGQSIKIQVSALTFQMPRSPRHLPQGYSYHITLRCNSRQLLIAKGLRRDVLLAVLAKAQAKIPHKLYRVCLKANHLHLLIRPDDASQLPRLMHWVGWFQ